LTAAKRVTTGSSSRNATHFFFRLEIMLRQLFVLAAVALLLCLLCGAPALVSAQTTENGIDLSNVLSKVSPALDNADAVLGMRLRGCARRPCPFLKRHPSPLSAMPHVAACRNSYVEHAMDSPAVARRNPFSFQLLCLF